MREPLGQTLAQIATVDPQGPFNYGLYRLYALVVGSEERVVRFLPALIGVLGVPALYALAAQLSGWRVGLLAALLWALSPVAIWHAQDARSYVIWSVVNPIAVWLALRALTFDRRIDWVLYVLAAVLALYVYYLELFTVFALNLYVILRFVRGLLETGESRNRLGHWVLAQVVVLLLIAPWYLQERLLSGGGYAGTAAGFELGRLWSDLLPALVFGEKYPFPAVVPAVVGVLLVGSCVGLWRVRWRSWWLLALLVVIPILALSLVSLRLDVFVARYILSVSAVVVVFVSVAGMRWRRVGVGLVGLLWVGQVVALHSYWYDYTKSPDWRSLSAYILRNASPHDTVIQAAADEAFTFYCQEYHLSEDCDQKLPAGPAQPADEIVSVLTMRIASSRGIWYVANPPGWSNAAVALDWLRANSQEARSARFAGLPTRYFLPWQVDSDEIRQSPLARYLDTAELADLRVLREPDGRLVLWLYWQPLAATVAPLKVFVHLTDSHGIVAQSDQFPQAGRIDTTTWQTRVLFRDIHTIVLPDTALQNNALIDYRLAIGLYDPVINQRVELVDGSDALIMPVSEVLTETG